jgi:hypothetical protein
MRESPTFPARPAVRALLAVALAATAGAAPLAAQPRPSVEITLPTPIAAVRTQGPLVTAHDMLASAKMRDLLLNGFPARFHYRVELWSVGGLFNALIKPAEYFVVVRYIALEKMYEVTLYESERKPLSLGKFVRVEDADAAVSRPTRVALPAPSSSRAMYYEVTLRVDALQLSDLDDVSRWLRGVSGERNAGTAASRGIRAIAARLLGGESREYTKTSDRFKVE